MVETENGLYKGEHTFTFTEKRWHNHLRSYFIFVRHEISTIVALILSLWAITEIMALVANNQVPIKNLVLPVFSISLITVMYKAYIKYRSYAPDTLKNETRAVQKIFWSQNIGWQFALAKKMLENRIIDFDSKLSRIASGSEFIAPKPIDYDNYVTWMRERPTTMVRLINAVAIQCTSELPEILTQTKEEDQLDALKKGISRMATLYEETMNLESECHQIIPPDEFTEVHELTFGWTESIRKGVKEFLEMLNRLATIDKRSLKAGTAKLPDFNITFEPPPNVEKFSKKLEAMSFDTM